MIDRSRLLMSIWAGEPTSSMGVFLYSSNARYGSRLSCFTLVNRLFTVWTAFSTRPFACGFSGLVMVCLNSHDFANDSYSFEEYWGPLSLITLEGIPCRANADFTWVMTAMLLVSGSFATSKNLVIHDNNIFRLVPCEKVCGQQFPWLGWYSKRNHRLLCVLPLVF